MSIADFKLVETQAIELHERWMTYCQLFGSAAHRSLLNDSGEAFFALTAELYREGILSSLYRLTDWPTTASQWNVTVKILPDICPQVKSNLENQINELDDLVQPLKQLRHKRVGHTDLGQARQSGVRPVPEFGKKVMEGILARVCGIVDAARDSITGSTVHFDYKVNTVAEVEYLLEALERARQHLGET